MSAMRGGEGVGFWEFGLGWARKIHGEGVLEGIIMVRLLWDGESRRGLGDGHVCQHLYNGCKRMGTGWYIIIMNHDRYSHNCGVLRILVVMLSFRPFLSPQQQCPVSVLGRGTKVRNAGGRRQPTGCIASHFQLHMPAGNFWSKPGNPNHYREN